jgi:hypothetical protein
VRRSRRSLYELEQKRQVGLIRAVALGRQSGDNVR